VTERRRARTTALSLAWACAWAPSAGAQSPGPVSAEVLTQVRSVVAGEPRWLRDGRTLLFPASLGDGGLWTIPAAGGFPRSLEVQTGGAAFLGSSQVELSPDGRWISFLSTRSGTSELWIASTADGRVRQLTRLGGRTTAYAWAPDGRTIAFANDQLGNHDIWTVAVPDGTVRRLTTEPLLEVQPTWTPDGREVVYVRLDTTWRDHDILAVPAAGGAARLITRDRDFFDYQAGGTFGTPAVSPDGRTVLFRSHRSGWINIWRVPLAGGEATPLAAEAANQSGARWSPDGRSVLLLSLSNGRQSLKVVSVADGRVRTLAEPPAQGMVSAAEWAPDGGRVSYLLGTPVAPADLHVVAATGGVAQRLTVSDPPRHVAAALVVPEKVSYRSPDGLTIPAYLYRPRGVAAGAKAPGLLLIHGGPTAQFSDSWQREAQYFAQRGYAVLLPNIRGSSGYGKAFEDANNGCWGRCDLADVLAGVDYLRAQPGVRGDRIGISGTSYGGYMSIAAPTFAPGVFQAAVAASGYADWAHTHGEQETRHVKLLDYEFGPLATHGEVYRRSSPMHELERLATPILVVHGEATTIPRSAASRLLVDRLEMLYKPHEYRTYPNENYYVSGRANVIRLLEDTERFLARYLQDDVPPRPLEED
jgi:dipeptidyl aminopeptidase/acylaminoacyl peptidase